MPKYRNDTEHPIASGGASWMPGEERGVNFFVPATLGLTKTDDEPLVSSPILLSQSVILEAGVPKTVGIPWGADRIIISAVPESGGSAVLKIGDGTVGIPLNDTSGGYVSPAGGHPWDKAAKVTMESTEGTTVSLLVEGVM